MSHICGRDMTYSAGSKISIGVFRRGIFIVVVASILKVELTKSLLLAEMVSDSHVCPLSSQNVLQAAQMEETDYEAKKKQPTRRFNLRKLMLDASKKIYLEAGEKEFTQRDVQLTGILGKTAI